MKKDYKQWHSKKSIINNIGKAPFFHEREIWFCHLGSNVGFEQDGSGQDFLRPIIVFRKFNNNIFWAIPLTTTLKQTKFYFVFSFESGNSSSAILSQIRLIDARRLSHKIGDISELDFLALIKKLKELLP